MQQICVQQPTSWTERGDAKNMTQLINLAESNTVQMSNDSKYHKKVARKKREFFLLNWAKRRQKHLMLKVGPETGKKSLRSQT